MPAVSPQEVRQRVQHSFSELAQQDRQITGETLLVRGGEYCGHRYHTDDMAAVWFLEEDQIKFYNAEGHVLDVVSATESRGEKEAA